MLAKKIVIVDGKQVINEAKGVGETSCFLKVTLDAHAFAGVCFVNGILSGQSLDLL